MAQDLVSFAVRQTVSHTLGTGIRQKRMGAFEDPTRPTTPEDSRH